MYKIINYDKNGQDFLGAITKLIRPDFSRYEQVSSTVSEIISNVCASGDSALFEYTKKFDKFDINESNLKVSEKEIESGYNSTDKNLIKIFETAYERIRDYHEKQVPLNEKYDDTDGFTLGWKWTPLESVGLYVPGGKAFYPSTVLMNAIPALIAGVGRLAMVVPCPDGYLNPVLLAAARACGISEIYKIGGAQAIAALAYGTESVMPVVKIVGPGNAYVAEAKRQVFGVVGIDMIAGPSEILIIANNKINPRWIAADLLSQAEHDSDARVVLITDDKEFAKKVCIETEVLIEKLNRKAIAAESIKNNGFIFVVKNLEEEAPLIANIIAPEHLEVATDEPEKISKKIHNAGAIFLGKYCPEAFGDYMAGPSHVLPTSGSAKFSSGLGVYDFIKRTSMIKATEDSLKSLGEKIITFANSEGLDAHALSVKVRM